MRVLTRCTLGIASLFLVFQTSSVEAQAPKEKAKVNTDWEKKADLNKDGVVDEHESAMWKDKHLLPPGIKKKADLNKDGVVDNKELSLWKKQRGQN